MQYLICEKLDGISVSLKYTNGDGKEHSIDVEGIMVHIGQVPNSQFVEAEKDKIGQIVVDQKCRTNLPGIFAAAISTFSTPVSDASYMTISAGRRSFVST